MDNKVAYDALVQVAKQRGVPVEKVIEEIEAAIRIGYDQAKKDNDRKALARWRDVPSAGEIPTAVELVAYFQRFFD